MSIFKTDRELRANLEEMREQGLKLAETCVELVEHKVRLLEEVWELKQNLYACNRDNKRLQCKLDRAICILQSFASGETDEMIVAQEEAREFLKSVNRSVSNENSNG